MAITDGLAIGCGNLQASGGIKRVLIREWNSTGFNDDIILGATSDLHQVTSIKDSGAINSRWGVYESKIETSSLTIAGTTEKNVSTYECTLSFNAPQITADKIHRITSMRGKCLMAMVEDTNGTWMVIGISDTLTGGDGGLDIPAASPAGLIGTRPQTFATLSSVEGGTGAAFSDENGLTITLNCTQFELPRLYVNATDVVYDADGLTATVV
tara:strand:+ start:16 stop:651 length:636 start_codon:yes stop_codon:yes gene_type:complete